MKKICVAFFAIVIFMFMLTGCGAKYKDGTYRAEMPEYDHGWKDYLVVEVKDNELFVKEFDSANEAGELKSASESYRESMEPVTGTYPAKYLKDIVDEFNSKDKKVNKVAAVAGATESTDSFKLMMKAIIENAKNGITDTAVVSLEEKA